MNEVAERQERVPAYAWVIFALTFGLLICAHRRIGR